jgi:hypothetical protein
MSRRRVFTAAVTLFFCISLVFLLQNAEAVDSTKELLDKLNRLKTDKDSDIPRGREAIEWYEGLGAALEEVKQYEKEELIAATADKTPAEREEALKKLEESYKQKVRALDEDFSRDWEDLYHASEKGYPPEFHDRERIELREEDKRVDWDCEDLIYPFRADEGDAAEKEVEQYRKRRKAMERLYQHEKHKKNLSKSERKALDDKYWAARRKLYSDTEGRLKKIAADRKEKERSEAEKKAKEREAEKRAAEQKEQEETRRILKKADDAPFLKEANYPPEMLADPEFLKVLKAYRITLERQKKKIMDCIRGRDFAQREGFGKTAAYWESELAKTQKELVILLETCEKNLARLKTAWEAAQARKRQAEGPQPPDPLKDNKEAQAIKAQFDRVRQIVRERHQREMAEALARGDAHRHQLLKDALAKTMEEIDKKEKEALEKLKK